MFVKAVFESSFSLAYVLFVASSTVYHEDKTFGVTVDMIRVRSSFPSSGKGVVGAADGDMIANNTVVSSSKGIKIKHIICQSI